MASGHPLTRQLWLTVPRQAPVRSALPQGSVVWPVLFLIYINDLGARVSSRTRLFSDDTILYRFITASEDHNALQADLQKLEEWEEEWDMRYYPSKCSVLIVSGKLTTSSHQCKLHNQVLENVSSIKYLSVTHQHNAKFDQHIAAVVAKTNRTLDFLRRNQRIGQVTSRHKLTSLLCTHP